MRRTAGGIPLLDEAHCKGNPLLRAHLQAAKQVVCDVDSRIGLLYNQATGSVMSSVMVVL